MPVVDYLLSYVAPHACVACGIEGTLLCEWCELDAFMPVPGRCFRCKRLSADSATCSTCIRQIPLKNVWVRTEYDGIPKQLLHRFKFERAVAAVGQIARATAETLPYLPATTLIIPVPTATSRVRQRGYDHAVLIAKEIAKQTGLPYQEPVVRLTQTRQVGAGRKLRLSQLEAAFFVTQPQMVRRKDILLIDDVVTTGATLQAVARALKQAGAKSVRAAVFAQKQ